MEFGRARIPLAAYGQEVTAMDTIWDLGDVDAEAEEFDVLANKSY